jgi:hypothetical protein
LIIAVHAWKYPAKTSPGFVAHHITITWVFLPSMTHDGSWSVETLPCGTGVKRCTVPISLDAMALIIHLNTSPMDGTASLVIFTTLHGPSRCWAI